MEFMKVVQLRLYRYHLKLAGLLKLRNQQISERVGYIVELVDSSGNTGIGEIAPLPVFSHESLSDVEQELMHLKSFLLNRDLPDGVERFDGGFDRLVGGMLLSPSTRFGIESAILNLFAPGAGVASLIGADKISHVKVNALLSGTRNEVLTNAATAVTDGYAACKLKIAGMTVDDAVALTESVRQTIGSDVALRLDANRSFVLEDAIELMRQLGPMRVEYVEEPAKNLGQLRKLLGEKNLGAGVALDESLQEIRPEDLSLPYAVRAIVVKPTLLGLERAYQFGKAALGNGMVPVVSSSFESSIGLSVLAALAAALGGSEVPAGLDTLGWLRQDLVTNPPRASQGQISLAACMPDRLSLKRELLTEVPVG